ncbi:hypothetical protein CHARACLAT_007418 [Characodon lateralis]|uniref:Uncharacterized protein n=1 Tax=Characodon lateralis TaxID=208331 RepID=A0ABU7DP56_9TELE|nr:hypothetical protein [Characodon lateralis]
MKKRNTPVSGRQRVAMTLRILTTSRSERCVTYKTIRCGDFFLPSSLLCGTAYTVVKVELCTDIRRFKYARLCFALKKDFMEPSGPEPDSAMPKAGAAEAVEDNGSGF